MKDIHDIRPPVSAGFEPGILDILSIILALAVLIFIIWIMVRLYKKGMLRKKQKNIKMLPPPLPAKDIALTELDAVKGLMKDDRRLFYFKLTAILKKYINREFNTNALEMTSQELIKSMKSLDIKPDLKLSTSRFIEFSDHIKYAAMPARLEEVKKDLNTVKNFVIETSEKMEGDLNNV